MGRSILFSLFAAFLFSCTTFYEANLSFNQNFESGNLEEARIALKQNRKAIKRKAKLLYYANMGVIYNMQGEFAASNNSLEKAYLLGEDYRRNYLNLAASFISNPNTVDYSGEDHEHLFLLYYKALNYLQLNDFESALVEVRRLSNRLNELSDRYRSDNKYSRDAFVNNLMGLIYDASGDPNNAFIAYRNAYEVYKDDYARFFGMEIPRQLKSDLIRTAYESGFDNEVDFYEKEFGVKYNHSPLKNGELIFFWQNGLSPIKDEWSINFASEGDGDGGIVFVNEDLGFSFPFSGSGNNEDDKITDIEILRIAIPKYVERPLRYKTGFVTVNGQTHELELSEDVNAIAFKVLKQRMGVELGKAVVRAATKKALEQSVEGENEGLGFLVGLVNAATEKADTRNWQTLPHSIYYSRIPLKQGENSVVLSGRSENGFISKLETFTFNGTARKTYFHSFQTLN